MYPLCCTVGSIHRRQQASVTSCVVSRLITHLASLRQLLDVLTPRKVKAGGLLATGVLTLT